MNLKCHIYSRLSWLLTLFQYPVFKLKFVSQQRSEKNIWKIYLKIYYGSRNVFKKWFIWCANGTLCKWNINFVHTNQVFFKNLSNMSDSILLWKFASILHILCLDTYFFCWLVTWMKTLSIINLWSQHLILIKSRVIFLKITTNQKMVIFILGSMF